MVTLERFLADVHARGYRILEHPKYGGVDNNRHMAGSAHATGDAADINWGPAGAPASERVPLLWVCRLAEAAGFNVIYAHYRTHPNARTNANHRDHAHIDRTPVYKRALKPRYPGGNDALYRRILNEKPLGGTGKKRKPHAIRTIKLGSKGFPVGLWQKFLNVAINAKLKVDSDFGPATDKATREYQGKAGLEKDGVVGEHTWFRACYGVERGDRGPRVEIAQRVMGYTGKSVDAVFGKNTEGRAKEVQRYVGVSDDGNWGPKTINAMLEKG